MMDKLKQLDTHTMIVATTCLVIIMAALYFMLYGLIHDGPFALNVIDYFKYLISILTGGATLSTIVSQVADYLKSRKPGGTPA